MLLARVTYGVVIINNPPLQIPFPDGTLGLNSARHLAGPGRRLPDSTSSTCDCLH